MLCLQIATGVDLRQLVYEKTGLDGAIVTVEKLGFSERSASELDGLYVKARKSDRAERSWSSQSSPGMV